MFSSVGSPREVTEEQTTQNGASVTHSPVTVGAARTEREMSTLNSALTNVRVHQESSNKRHDQGWGNPILILIKSQRCTGAARDGGFGMQFSVSLRVEHLLSYVRSMLRKLCQGLGGTFIRSHISCGSWTTHQLAGGEDREAQAGPH